MAQSVEHVQGSSDSDIVTKIAAHPWISGFVFVEVLLLAVGSGIGMIAPLFPEAGLYLIAGLTGAFALIMLGLALLFAVGYSLFAIFN